MENVKIYNMDCLEGIKKLPDHGVNCIIFYDLLISEGRKTICCKNFKNFKNLYIESR